MKTILTKNRHVVVQIISYLYILLFVYTAISKLLDFENFGIQLAQSPPVKRLCRINSPVSHHHRTAYRTPVML